jgi:glycosyltransferase involved in cell wall biosynthesis
MADTTLPRISVIVTCFNCRDYVGDAVRSVARQTLRDFDCVIVDDASTDDSAAVVQRTLGELGNDPRFRQVRLPKNVGQTGATRAGLAQTQAPFVCFLDSDDLWNEDFLERHLAAHLNESYAVGFTACNARLLDGQGALIAGAVYWFGKDRAVADRGQAFAPIDPARVPSIDAAGKSADWRRQTPYRLYTKRLVHWVWVSTSSMMFRRSLIDLVFPEDDEAFRLHMDFYVVVMAQMVSGSLLIDQPLYSYRLHGKNFAANNPVLGGRLHLSASNWGDTYATMLDRMLTAMVDARERFVTALGDRQYRRMLFRMKAARASPWTSWLFVLRSWLI